MKKYILASGSPRRKQLLKSIGLNFEIIKSDYEENISDKTFSYEIVEKVAQAKGEAVLKNLSQNAVIISADTVVVNDNKILGKPKDFENAFEMLKNLRGKTHFVVTSICIIDSETQNKHIESETSEVTFNNISDEQIIQYIKEYKPYDKAGSYGIQELPAGFIKNIKGDYDNIVGLPTKNLINILRKISA